MKKSANVLFYIVIIYILIAGFWWYLLLHSKNQEAKAAKLENVRMELQDTLPIAVELSADYQQVVQEYERQEWMIFLEGIVFIALLLFGLWRIYQSHQRKVALANQQQNFLLSITHELKSPIASVQLVLETLNKRELTTEQIKRLSQNGLNDNQRLHKLVQDLLLAARVEGGHEYSFETLDLTEMVQECIRWVESRFNGQITLTIPENDPVININADYNTLSSAIFNLLENASKYAKDTDLIEVIIKCKKEQVTLEIIDQGIGIPKSERGKIFDKFYRIGSEHTRRTKGTGLGLYIVKKVVNAHQGSIQIKENQPKGSIFVLTLPLKK